MKRQVNLIVRLLMVMTLILQFMPISVVAETLAQTPASPLAVESKLKVAELKGEKLKEYLESLSEEERRIVESELSQEQLVSLEELVTADTEEASSENQSGNLVTSETELTTSQEIEEISETSDSNSVESSEETTSEEQPSLGTALNFSGAGPLMASLEQPEDDNLVLKKTANYNKDTNKVEFQLEAYAKGKIVTNMSPTDIVFVLDVSGSMDDLFGPRGNRKRKMTALKESVNEFATKMEAEQSKLGSGQYHTMRIVIYSGSASTYATTYRTDNASQMANFKTAINNLSAGGGTRQDSGMSKAETIVAANKANTTRTANQAVILFTDGQPEDTWYSAGQIASAAVNIAQRIKNEYEATIYSVGIQDNANPSSTSSSDIPNSMLNGISTNYPQASVSNSNNYKNTLSLGARNPNGHYYLTSNNATDLRNIFQEIATQIGRIENLTIRDVLTEELFMPTLDNASVELSQVKVYQAWEYDPSLRAIDNPQIGYVQGSKQLDIKNITLQPIMFDSNNNPTAATKNNKLIIRFEASVHGQFMGGNQVVTNKQASGAYTNSVTGETLLKEFSQPTVNIPLKDTTLTTQDQKIYLGNSTQVGNFFENIHLLNGQNNRYVNVTYTIKKNQVELASKTILAGQSFQDDLFNELRAVDKDTVYEVYYRIEASQPALPGTVGVSPIEKTKTTNVYVYQPTISVPERKIYFLNSLNFGQKLPVITGWHHPQEAAHSHLEFTVTAPRIDGVTTEVPGELTADKVMGKIKNITLSNRKNLTQPIEFPIFIFKPEVRSNNKTIGLGEKTFLAERQQEIKWTNPETTATEIEGVAPDLTLTPYKVGQTTAENNQVMPTETTNYYWQVKIDNQLITKFTRFINTDYENNQVPADTHFTIYVKPASLTIKKEISPAVNRQYGAESFLFEIVWHGEQGSETYYEVITLTGDQVSGEKTLTNLKSGAYTITEITDWSSRYEAEAAQKEVSVTSGKLETVVFKNKLNNQKWLTHESKTENKYQPLPKKVADKR